jgi:peroxiredoxin Q/BCP
MIEVGEEVPEFEGAREDGSPIALASFLGHPVILFFYPKANSGGCSLEARGFAEHFAEFQSQGIAVIGVSVDSVDEQRRFAETCQLPFPLVADADRVIAKKYGVLGLLGIAKRVTFFVDAKGIVVDRTEGMLPGPHVQRAVERLSPAAGAP